MFNIYYQPSLLISYADEKDTTYAWKGYAIAVLLFVSQMFKSILFNFSFWTSQIIGMQLKTTLIAAIYKKVSEHIPVNFFCC